MTLEKSVTRFEGRVITVNVETVLLPNGQRADLEIIHHPGGAAVVAIDERERVCLLHQFRHAAGGWIWELPAGRLEPGEPPLVTARRELIEEAGVTAREWRTLGAYLSSPGVFTEVLHLFLATGLEATESAPERTEVFEVHWVPFREACDRAMGGDIRDAKSALALLHTAKLGLL